MIFSDRHLAAAEEKQQRPRNGNAVVVVDKYVHGNGAEVAAKKKREAL